MYIKMFCVFFFREGLLLKCKDVESAIKPWKVANKKDVKQEKTADEVRVTIAEEIDDLE